MLIRGYCFWRLQKRSKSSVSSQCYRKKGIKYAMAMPVTHIFSSPGEPTIISSVFIDLHEYLICMTFIIISQY